MKLPVFIQKRHLRLVEDSLLSGDLILDYTDCEGIDPDIYGEYKTLLTNHQEQIGKKIKEKNVSKRLKKEIKKLEYK